MNFRTLIDVTLNLVIINNKYRLQNSAGPQQKNVFITFSLKKLLLLFLSHGSAIIASFFSQHNLHIPTLHRYNKTRI